MPSNATTGASLTFRLDVDDGWPPVAAEVIPCIREAAGYRIGAAPFFVKGLSVGDVIEIVDEENGQVWAWKHVSKSGHSTVWAGRIGDTDVRAELDWLMDCGGRVEAFPDGRMFALDVPPSIDAASFDAHFGGFSDTELALAYPSWRHD